MHAEHRSRARRARRACARCSSSPRATRAAASIRSPRSPAGATACEPCDFAALARAGAVAFSDDGDTVRDARRAARRRRCEAAQACRGPSSRIAIPKTRSSHAIWRSPPRRGKPWHVAHVSTARALELVAAARARGTRVTCEVTPHHLTFTHDALRRVRRRRAGESAAAHRTTTSRLARRRARRNDRRVRHRPRAAHRERETRRQGRGGAGILGPRDCRRRVCGGVSGPAAAALRASCSRRIPLASSALRGGTLAVGEPADVTIFADRPWIVDPASFASKGRCTPFAGHRLPRRVLATVVGGDLRYRAPELA